MVLIIETPQIEKKLGLNPLTLMSDQDRISSYNINATSNRHVTTMKKHVK